MVLGLKVPLKGCDNKKLTQNYCFLVGGGLVLKSGQK